MLKRLQTTTSRRRRLLHKYTRERFLGRAAERENVDAVLEKNTEVEKKLSIRLPSTRNFQPWFYLPQAAYPSVFYKKVEIERVESERVDVPEGS